MNIYKVVGKIQFLQKCECDFCEGHKETQRYQFEAEAADEEEAALLALEAFKKKEWDADDVEWDDSDYRQPSPKITFIKEVTEEVLMLRAGVRPLWSLFQTA